MAQFEVQDDDEIILVEFALAPGVRSSLINGIRKKHSAHFSVVVFSK